MDQFIRKRYSRHGHLTVKEKLAAVRRVENGETKASVSRDINVPESTLRGWCKTKDRLYYMVNKVVDKSPDKTAFPTNIQPNKQIDWTGGIQNLISYEQRLTDNYKISNGGDSPGVLDLSNSAIQLQASQYHGLFPSGRSANPSMNFTQSNNRSIDLTSSPVPELKDFQKNGLFTPYALPVRNAPVDAKYFRPYQHIFESKNLFSTPPSSVLPSLPSHSSSVSLPPPVSTTPQTFPSKLLKPQPSGPLWQLNKLSQPIIEKMPDKTPATTASNINFNNNNRMPEGLSIRPIYRSVETKTEEKGEKAVRVSAPKSSSKSKPLQTIKVSPDALSDKLLNLNNNYIVAEKDSDAGVVGLSEAIQYAEKFSKWFETYSDPTITTQDVMRFEKLLGKVRNIVERKNNATAQSLKIHRRK